jgi:NAD+ diphosphatase
MRPILPSRPNAYTGGRLDRAGFRREDDAWLDQARPHPDSRHVYLWRGQPLIEGDPPRAVLAPVPPADAAPWVFLGLQAGTPLFAHDLSALDAPPAPRGAYTELRALTSLLPPDDATILATARGMLNWRATTRFCPRCGAGLTPIRGGYVLHCPHCGAEQFPRTDAAVIMLVTRGAFLLLGQSLKFPVERNMFSTLAGFVEPGENLEDAVRREVAEEVGVRVGAVAYHSSQPWPFPASLMLGFYAEALSEEITLDPTEMRAASWFTRADIDNRKTLGFNLPPPDSIARRLIEDWLAQT